MSEENKVPVWGYKDSGDDFVSEIHMTKDGKLPQGWKDDPAKCKNFKPEEK